MTSMLSQFAPMKLGSRRRYWMGCECKVEADSR